MTQRNLAHIYNWVPKDGSPVALREGNHLPDEALNGALVLPIGHDILGHAYPQRVQGAVAGRHRAGELLPGLHRGRAEAPANRAT